MKRTIAPIIVVILFLSGLAGSSAQAGEKCTEATLNGRYGFHTQGVRYGGQELFVTVGITTFDGAGRWASRNTASRNGKISRGNPSGRYTVNSECTGSMMNEGGGLIQDIVIVDGDNEIRSLARNPDTSPVWAGLYKKQRVEQCTAANMKGSWGYSFQGSIFEGESVRPAAVAGLATFDGKGSVRVTEWRNVGGEYTELSLEAGYSVSSDCTIETGTTSYGTFVGDGSETFTMRTIDGWVVSGFPKKQ